MHSRGLSAALFVHIVQLQESNGSFFNRSDEYCRRVESISG